MSDSNIIDATNWQDCLDVLSRALSKSQYEKHFLGSEAIKTNKGLTIHLPKTSSLDVIHNRLSAVIQRATKSAWGDACNIPLFFVVGYPESELESASAPEHAEVSKTPLQTQGFTPVADGLARKLGLAPAAVYGVVWRFCQMNNRTCYASQATIANHLGIDRKTVNRHIKSLLSDGYIRCLNGHEKGMTKVYIVANKIEIDAAFVMRAKEK